MVQWNQITDPQAAAAGTLEELAVTPTATIAPISRDAASIQLFFNGQLQPLGPAEAFDFTPPRAVTYSIANAGYALDDADRVHVIVY